VQGKLPESPSFLVETITLFREKKIKENKTERWMDNERAITLLTEELRALNLRTQRLEAELHALQQREALQADFAKGDRVYITNRVRRPSSWLKNWTNDTVENEKRATVTHKIRDRVWLVTDNGTKTWRAPHNLAHALKHTAIP
jgi:hypothetical protein